MTKYQLPAFELIDDKCCNSCVAFNDILIFCWVDSSVIIKSSGPWEYIRPDNCPLIKVEENKTCDTCRYETYLPWETPCGVCNRYSNYIDRWEKKK